MKIIQKAHQFGKDKVEVGAMNAFVMTGVSYTSKASPARQASEPYSTKPVPWVECLPSSPLHSHRADICHGLVLTRPTGDGKVGAGPVGKVVSLADGTNRASAIDVDGEGCVYSLARSLRPSILSV